jgi:hypothetical protein
VFAAFFRSLLVRSGEVAWGRYVASRLRVGSPLKAKPPATWIPFGVRLCRFIGPNPGFTLYAKPFSGKPESYLRTKIGLTKSCHKRYMGHCKVRKACGS